MLMVTRVYILQPLAETKTSVLTSRSIIFFITTFLSKSCQTDSNVCFVKSEMNMALDFPRERDNRTPLHLAALEGNIHFYKSNLQFFKKRSSFLLM